MATNQKSLKIGLVLDSSLDLEDGVQQYVVTIGEWLRQNGHDVHYLVGQTKSRQLPNIHTFSKNIVVKFNGNKINLPLSADRHKLAQVLSQHQFDVLHIQTPHHPLLAQKIILSAPPSTAVLATFHILPYGRLAHKATAMLGVLLKKSLARIDKMLAVSEAAAKFERQTFGVEATVLPNAFDYNTYLHAKPLAKYRGDVPTIMFLGRLVKRKGCLTLLKSISILNNDAEVGRFRVVICGKGELERSLRKYVASKGLTEIVEFCGFIENDEKPRYLASADISVFPSTGGESFGIVLLEAMASGKSAVLAGDNPGYRSIMEHHPGSLFPANNITELAGKIKELLANKSLRGSYAAWGTSRAEEFDVNVVGAELTKAYNDTIASKNMR